MYVSVSLPSSHSECLCFWVCVWERKRESQCVVCAYVWLYVVVCVCVCIFLFVFGWPDFPDALLCQAVATDKTLINLVWSSQMETENDLFPGETICFLCLAHTKSYIVPPLHISHVDSPLQVLGCLANGGSGFKLLFFKFSFAEARNICTPLPLLPSPHIDTHFLPSSFSQFLLTFFPVHSHTLTLSWWRLHPGCLEVGRIHLG